MIRDKLSKIEGPNEFLRIDAGHPLDFFIGTDPNNRLTLIIETKAKLRTLKGTSIIEVSFIKTDDLNRLIFILRDDYFKDLFINLGEDLMAVTLSFGRQESNKALIALLNRFYLWKKLFSREKPKYMTDNTIKGLYGELTFFINIIESDNIIPENLLKAWTGPERKKRDYEFEDKWFEIKSINKGNSLVTIPSIEQLDIEIDGTLFIYELEYTNLESDKTPNLNQLVQKINSMITAYDLKDMLFQKLLSYGYVFDEYYDDYRYNVANIKSIPIDENAKILRRKEIPESINDAKYSIDFNKIMD